MRTFGATVLLMVVAFACVAVLGRRLETVEPVEEPPAWSYDRDAATVVAPIQAAPAPEPIVRERTRVPVTVQDGAIVIGADDVLTEEVEATLTIPTERFDAFVQDLHRDDERQDYWLDLVDGRRIELDAATAAAVSEARPLRMTYEREGETQAPLE